ncbi:hypothetical protein EV644_111193 [Kribbella orskensis]|uniref:Uncharacterized protein n=1 Tax=Kribbella orskensis TaxID=2512216 RepID=A0ABY2BG15_9ACTN|nr:hypothetical protein EV642_11172 [Kribbella sp. VKM Ac-2500]TCO18955.1 hypothetical protein EV644_111193 [Kribbella orskensis]
MQRPQAREPDRRSRPPSRSARTRPAAACRRASTRERPANQQLTRPTRATHAPDATAPPAPPQPAQHHRSPHLVHRPSTRRRARHSPQAQSASGASGRVAVPCSGRLEAQKYGDVGDLVRLDRRRHPRQRHRGAEGDGAGRAEPLVVAPDRALAASLYRARSGGAVVPRAPGAALYLARPGWRRRTERPGWSPSGGGLATRRGGCLARVWVGNPAQPG